MIVKYSLKGNLKLCRNKLIVIFLALLVVYLIKDRGNDFTVIGLIFIILSFVLLLPNLIYHFKEKNVILDINHNDNTIFIKNGLKNDKIELDNIINYKVFELRIGFEQVTINSSSIGTFRLTNNHIGYKKLINFLKIKKVEKVNSPFDF